MSLSSSASLPTKRQHRAAHHLPPRRSIQERGGARRGGAALAVPPLVSSRAGARSNRGRRHGRIGAATGVECGGSSSPLVTHYIYLCQASMKRVHQVGGWIHPCIVRGSGNKKARSGQVQYIGGRRGLTLATVRCRLSSTRVGCTE